MYLSCDWLKEGNCFVCNIFIWIFLFGYFYLFFAIVEIKDFFLSFCRWRYHSWTWFFWSYSWCGYDCLKWIQNWYDFFLWKIISKSSSQIVFFNILGDEVWGATFPSSQGSHADFVTASTLTIAKVCDQGLW